ncbi:phage head spike fiber domain-containing protein [Aeromonas caviae]|uniref:phage head spike fiber domain-containing protein n=1 Tax=Aeromonas caviae TaxID=648 RepID=UPI0023AAA43D|nr:hypothetical protein [Aeromonas caviae]WEE21019.1 hypothetical protein PY772_18320 [Aeromonas caviae]
MAGLWQRTGNVTVTNGSKTITGFGTKWKTGTLPIQKGHTFYGPDNAAYEVDTVVSDTEILLVDTYRGGTMANQPYRIDITRTSTISQFAADLASLVAKYRSWFDGMMTWLTGSGDVAILNPDTGANVTIPSWKKVASEGEGQAARAKTEADKAAASAALAGDIVAVSALPLPDVWAPLSDSLRLLTGFGRDVLVGSDVVARMVNFSRNSTATYIGKDGQLKTAAANEPRFEKEGLLIEGQSQNLVTHSVDLSAPSWNKQQSGTGSAPVVTANYAQAPDGSMTACRLQLNKGAGTSSMDYSGVLHAISGFVVGATHTLSVWLKSANQNSYNIALSLNGQGLTIVAITPEWRRFTITVVLDDPNRYPRIQLRGGQGTSDTADILVWGWQQEALPFASSYIPTNGAAVTRAGEAVFLPWVLNMPSTNMTVALNYDVAGVLLASSQRLIEYAAPANPRYLIQINGVGELESFCSSVPVRVSSPQLGPGSLVVAATSQTRHALRVTGKPLTVITPTGLAAATTNINIGSGGGVSAPMFGHVRNLRIWHRTLTDDQIKAVT